MGLQKGHISYNLTKSGFDLIGGEREIHLSLLLTPLCVWILCLALHQLEFISLEKCHLHVRHGLGQGGDKHQALSKGPWLPRGLIAMM